MSARLGERLRGMLCSVGALFRAPYSGADAESRPVLRGNMRRAIVIKTPDDMFAEAVFILRDDYFQTPGISREALLRQARAAAEEYAAAYSPPGGGARLIALVALAVLVIGGAALALRLIGLI